MTPEDVTSKFLPKGCSDETDEPKSRIKGLLPKSISCFDKLSMTGKVT